MRRIDRKTGMLATIGFIVLITALLLGGCASGNQPSKPVESENTPASQSDAGGEQQASVQPEASQAEAPQAKEITIEYWTTGPYKNVKGFDTPNNGDYEKIKLEQFQKIHPNVKVNFQYVAPGAVEQKVTVALLGNNPPDILLDSFDRRLPKYVKFNKTESLNALFDASFQLDDFNQVLINLNTYDGEIFALPLTSSFNAFFINKTIFKEKGLEHLIPENRDWTFEQWKDILKQVSGDGIYGTAIYAGNEQADEGFLNYLFNAGAEQWDQNSEKIIMADYPQAAETIQLFKDLEKEGIIPPGGANMKLEDVNQLFLQGKVAVINLAPTLYNIVAAGKKDGSVKEDIELYGMRPVHASGQEPRTSIVAQGYMVFKQDDAYKKEMIFELLRYMASTESVKAMGESLLYAPSRTSSVYELPDHPDMEALMGVMSGVQRFNLGTTSPYYAEVRQLWFPALQSALLGNKTPEQAVADYTAQANALIEEKSKKEN